MRFEVDFGRTAGWADASLLVQCPCQDRGKRKVVRRCQRDSLSQSGIGIGYFAQHYDLDAIGFNATDIQHRRSYLKNHTREILAKTKVVLDMLLHKQPKFLGDPVPIP